MPERANGRAASFEITVETPDASSTLLRLAFGEPASNDVMVRDVDRRMKELKGRELTGGRLVLLNGAASLPVIAVIIHHVAHLFGAVAIYDPKLQRYVIVASHGSELEVGEILSVRNAGQFGR